jgi:CopG family transcriptional regulator/antitoxin EndoAI
MSDNAKRVMFVLPPALLKQVDEVVSRRKINRSRLIRQALEQFLEEQQRLELREQLKEGYLVHAERDRAIAEEFAYSDYEVASQGGHAPHDEEES